MNTFFDKIYLINLESRPDRYDSMIELFSKLGIDNFEIIRPKAPDDFDNSCSVLKTSMQSCKEAHLRIYQDALDKGYQKIMIFEDDCVFNQEDATIERDIEYHIARCIDFMQNNNWDLFYFDNVFGMVKSDLVVQKLIRAKPHIEIQRTSGKPFSHAYAISVPAIPGLIVFSEQHDFNIDKDMRLFPSDKKFFYTRGIFDQKVGDISDNDWNSTY